MQNPAQQTEPLKQTNLHAWHVEHGGRMVPYAGWEMPVRYDDGAVDEHRIVRRSAGLFDIDHMGQITITGGDAKAFLNRLVTWDVSTLEVGQSHYTLMCLENGGIVDDVFVYRRPDDWFVVVNAANRAKDFAWMSQQAAGFDVSVRDISDETYMLALQGPRALAVLQMLVSVDLRALPRFSAIEDRIAGVTIYMGRTGYTGEDGVELFFPAESVLHVWEAILGAGVATGIETKPIGLAARDSLRFEPGFALYGHEIDSDITPLEANLAWACSFEKDFIGKQALLGQKIEGLKKKLIGFELTENAVPRQGCAVTEVAGRAIGEVVEGLYAPTIDKYCGHAFVPPEYAAVGTPLFILIRDKPKAALVAKRPFYKPAYRN